MDIKDASTEINCTLQPRIWNHDRSEYYRCCYSVPRKIITCYYISQYCNYILQALPGTSAFFPFGPGPAFVFQTSSRPPNNTSGSFTSNISFDAISNVSNVVVAVSQNMGRSLDHNEPFGNPLRQFNSSVFLYKDGNWTSFKLRKRRNTFDLAKQITNQVFAAVNCE